MLRDLNTVRLGLLPDVVVCMETWSPAATSVHRCVSTLLLDVQHTRAAAPLIVRTISSVFSRIIIPRRRRRVGGPDCLLAMDAGRCVFEDVVYDTYDVVSLFADCGCLIDA